MRHEEIMCKFFDFSAPTYYKRKKKDNLAIKMIEKYFTDSEIHEFIKNYKINKLDNFNYFNDFFLSSTKEKYAEYFSSNSLINNDFLIKDFYFYFLVNIKNKKNFVNNDILFDTVLLDNYTFTIALNEYVFDNIKNEISDKIKEVIDDNIISKEIQESMGVGNKIVDEYSAMEILIREKQEKFKYIITELSFIQKWSDDMYLLLDTLTNEDFKSFIGSDNLELLYHSIGYLVYSCKDIVNLSASDKLDIVRKTYYYFINNKTIIDYDTVRKHILLKFSDPIKFESYYNEIIEKEEYEQVKKMMKNFNKIE